MRIVEKTAGEKIAYTATAFGNSITFGDNDLTINLRHRQMDEPVTIDICADSNDFLVIGAATGRRYVAQVEIPAKTYTDTVIGTDSDGNPIMERSADPFNIDDCNLYLWGLEV